MPSTGMRRRVRVMRSDVSGNESPPSSEQKHSAAEEQLPSDGDGTFLQNVGPRRYLPGVTSQKTAFFILTAAKTSNLTQY
jgi:hypothetical protein